jgi:hypothetical protein
MPVRRALKHVFEIGEWLDVVELGGGDEGADRRPAVGAPVGSGKQVILAAKRNGTNRALDGVGIKFDTSILEEVAKRVPAVQRITRRISKAAAGWDVASWASSRSFMAPTSGSQMSKRTLDLAVGAVEIDGSRRIGPLLRSIVVSSDLTLGGQRKTPCSSRFVNRQNPVPSQ